MHNYVSLAHKILEQGHTEYTRLGVPTLALHNQFLSYNLQEGFPLMTTKHVGHKSIIIETLWYLKGTTSIKYLEDNKVYVWSKFATPEGEIGKTYSYQFRNFNGIDQLAEVINQLTTIDKVTDRRAIINLYNPADLKEMTIPPCITSIQFHKYWIDGKAYLDSSVFQRSADFCLGVPYDIAEMALLTHIMAVYSGSTAANMTVFYGNVHIYEPHIAELKKQLANPVHTLPKLVMNEMAILFSRPEDLRPEYFEFTGITTRPKYNYELF